jgi:mevalonate kinase
VDVCTSSAPGKIILCGEYAVVFGHPGIAVPAQCHVEVTYEPGGKDWKITQEGVTGNPKKVDAYVHTILDACKAQSPMQPGALHIKNSIPLGKGMGSSTALTIAIARCVFTNAAESRDSPLQIRETILAIENIVNPGNSGIDFAVIWEERPVYFKKGQSPRLITLPKAVTDALAHAVLIDTGAPNEATPVLVTWMLSRHVAGEPEIEEAIHAIGACANRLEKGEDFSTIIRDHHQAQVNLGIVNAKTQSLIKKIEQEGGCAKVIGAGGKTRGSGIIIAFDTDPEIAKAMGFEVIENGEL